MPHTPILSHFQWTFCHVYFSNQSRSFLENYPWYCVRRFSQWWQMLHIMVKFSPAVSQHQDQQHVWYAALSQNPLLTFPLLLKIKLQKVLSVFFCFYFILPQHISKRATIQILSVYLLGSWLKANTNWDSTYQRAFKTPCCCFQHVEVTCIVAICVYLPYLFDFNTFLSSFFAIICTWLTYTDSLKAEKQYCMSDLECSSHFMQL